MTIIAYHNGIMAADRQAYLGRAQAGHMRKRKIWKLSDGQLLGISSSIIGAGDALRAWIERGQPMDDLPTIVDSERTNQFEILLVSADGGSVQIAYDTWTFTTVEPDIAAVGSGSAWALGAMAAGATAPGAVSIASRFDNFSGGGVDVIYLDSLEPGAPS